jgi:hypothetical protein
LRREAAHLPGLFLWIISVKIGKEVSVITVPKTAGIVGHNVLLSSEMLKALDVPGIALVERRMAQEVGCHLCRGCRSFCLPRDGWSIIAKVVRALSFHGVPGFLKDVMLSDCCSQF